MAFRTLCRVISEPKQLCIVDVVIPGAEIGEVDADGEMEQRLMKYMICIISIEN